MTEQAISDFRRIKCGDGNPLNWIRFNMEHDKCLKFLKESISRSNTEHIVVVTHHVPSFELLAPEFNGSPLNGAFTVELEDFIGKVRLITGYMVIHTGTLTKSSEERTVLQTSWGMYPIMNTRLSIQGNISSYIRINESRSVTDRLSSKMKKLFSIYEQKDLSEIKFHFGVPIGFVRDII